jgi:hypothetical protein
MRVVMGTSQTKNAGLENAIHPARARWADFTPLPYAQFRLILMDVVLAGGGKAASC